MKNYSSKKAVKGKTTYRTPSRFFFQKYLETQKKKIEKRNRPKKPF